jgi:large subunit ribosomal protein L21
LAAPLHFRSEARQDGLSWVAPTSWTKIMYAVIKTGGKQYKVAAGNLIVIEKLVGTAGDSVSFDEVLLVGGDNGTTLGSPLVAGAAVAGEIVDQKRTAKILVFKKRRRQNSKRSRGHRQEQTLVRITEILTDGKKPSKTAPKPEAKRAEKAAPKAKTESKQAAKKAEAKPAAKKPAAKAEKKTPARKPASKPKK